MIFNWKNGDKVPVRLDGMWVGMIRKGERPSSITFNVHELREIANMPEPREFIARLLPALGVK